MVDISIHRVVDVRTEVVEWCKPGEDNYYSLDITFIAADGSQQTVTAYSRHGLHQVDNPFVDIDPVIAEVIEGRTDDD